MSTWKALRPAVPAVLPLDLRRGWEEADLPRRVAALAAVPLTVLCVVLAHRGAGLAIGLTASLGPVTYYALARVLRPHVGQDGERTARHALAAVGTSYGVLVLSVLPGQPNGAMEDPDVAVFVYLGLPAAPLGVVTACWGVIACGARARDERP